MPPSPLRLVTSISSKPISARTLAINSSTAPDSIAIGTEDRLRQTNIINPKTPEYLVKGIPDAMLPEVKRVLEWR